MLRGDIDDVSRLPMSWFIDLQREQTRESFGPASIYGIFLFPHFERRVCMSSSLLRTICAKTVNHNIDGIINHHYPRYAFNGCFISL